MTVAEGRQGGAEDARQRLAAGLAELSGLLLSRAELPRTLGRVADLARDSMPGCDAVGVTVVQGERVETAACTDDVVQVVDGAQYDTGQGPCLDAIRHQRPYLIRSMATERRWPRFTPAAVQAGIQASLSLPMTADEPVGALNCYARTPDAFDQADEQVGQLLADQAAVALTNLRTYAEEHRIAVALQRSLLPAGLPTVGGVELTARYLPASAEIHVGGDWYDALALADGTVGLVIGDVAGHGVAAAAIMGQLRTAWRAYTLDGHPPAGIIERLHRLLATVEPEVLATCCCVVADPSSGLVRWASAGHLDPLMRAPDTTTAFLDGGRTVPLGVPLDGSGDPIPEGQATLAPGSLLLLYTDGLVERRQESLQAGLNRLAHALAVGPEQLEACCDHLVAESLADQTVTDDVALVAVRLLTNPSSATRAQAGQPRQA
jgi:serine phosphatase RsbU (regulator of sigma subunit)